MMFIWGQSFEGRSPATHDRGFLLHTAVFYAVRHHCELRSNASCWVSAVFVHSHLNWRQVMELVSVTNSSTDINTWWWKQLGNGETSLQNKNKSHQLHKLKDGKLPAVGRRGAPDLRNLLPMLLISKYCKRTELLNHPSKNNCIGVVVKCKRHLPFKISFSIPFWRALVSHIYINDDFAKQKILSGHITFLTQAVTLFLWPFLMNYTVCTAACSHWISCKCPFTKRKCSLSVFISSLLHPFIRAFGEGEGGVACCSGGCSAQTAGAAPEGCGWAGAEATGLLPGWVGQGPPHLPGGGWQVQDSHATAGLSLHNFSLRFCSIYFNYLISKIY